MVRHLTIYCDGSGFNGKTAAYCTFKEGEDPIIVRLESNTTSNEAEYLAVIAALEKCEHGERIITDSQLVVQQVTGRWRVKALNLRNYHKQASKLVNDKKADLRWTSRDTNLAGAALEKYISTELNK